MDAPDAAGPALIPEQVGPSGPVSMLGWSHSRAPLAVLEQVAVPQGERAALLAQLGRVDREVVLLSTCSRTEVYAGPSASLDEQLVVLAQQRGCPPEVLAATAERRVGSAAVEHLFRVTSGLESRIVGEPEVCGQVRRAVRDARRAGTVGPVLTGAFGAAVRCAQRMRDVSGLGTARQSWGVRAVDVGLRASARPRATGGASAPGVLVVGAGRMATDVVEALAARGLAATVVARDESAARRLVGAARACPLTALVDAMSAADLVYCATSAAHDVVTSAQVRQARAGQWRPLTIVDLSVPRNVQAAVARLPGVHLLGPDDLADDARTDPQLVAAVETATALVQVEAERYVTAVAARRAGPLIAGLRRHVEDLCLAELARAAPGGTGSDDLVRAAHLVAVRLLHQPTLVARAAAAAGDVAALRLLADAFGVPDHAAVPTGARGA